MQNRKLPDGLIDKSLLHRHAKVTDVRAEAQPKEAPASADTKNIKDQSEVKRRRRPFHSFVKEMSKLHNVPLHKLVTIGNCRCPFCRCQGFRAVELDSKSGFFDYFGFWPVTCAKCNFPFYRFSWVAPPVHKPMRPMIKRAPSLATCAVHAGSPAPGAAPAAPIRFSESPTRVAPKPLTNHRVDKMESIKSPIRIAPPGRDRYLGKTMEGVRAAPGMWLLGLGLVAGLGWAFSASNQNHKAVATEDLYSIKVSSIEVYVERATSAFLAMQSANRGFLLTGEPEYRDNFTRDRDKFSSTFADLRRYMAENGLSGDTLSAVKADVTLWFELSNKLIDRKRRGEFGEEDRLPLDECLALESKILRNLDKMLPASALAQRRWTPYVPSKDTTPASDPQQ